jgi:putative glutamine amidotransferase
MKKPIIGLNTTYKKTDDGRFLCSLDRRYFDYIIRNGATPIIIPTTTKNLDEITELVDGLVMTGGAQVDPRRYGSIEELPPDFVLQRDQFDFSLIGEATKKQKPIFGICLGMQQINVFHEGTLKFVQGHIETTHPMDKWIVNSSHRKAVDKLGEGLRVVARANDGIVEIIESEDGLLFGVQFHPEQIFEHNPFVNEYVRKFVDRCGERYPH